MPGPFATPNTWFCAGCGKTHPLSVWIEGDDGKSGYWCATSIRRGIKERRNDLPPQAFTVELMPEGEQTVILGCERNESPATIQLDLFG